MLIADDEAFVAFVEHVSEAEAYAVDAEFHGETSYYPRLAVLQLAVPGRVAVVDATTVDARPLRAVLEGAGLMVAHAGEQDLQVLFRATGALPARMLDTQVAAGFIGFGSPSLARLVDDLLGVRLEKGPRMSDWFKRPLTADQIRYAAADVAHLLDLRTAIEERLVATGRREWAYEESDRRRRVREVDVATAWWRLKGWRQLRGRARAVAQELAAWRESVAMATDRPARKVLGDEIVMLLADRAPKTLDELPRSRLFDAQRIPARIVADVLAAVARGVALPQSELRLPPDTDLPGPLQPLASLLAAWVTQRSRDLGIDPALVATRADIEAFLRQVPGNRLERGWRAELVGADAARVVAGSASVGYDPQGGLVLVDRPDPGPG